jgi:hypothetical protein
VGEWGRGRGRKEGRKEVEEEEGGKKGRKEGRKVEYCQGRKTLRLSSFLHNVLPTFFPSYKFFPS